MLLLFNFIKINYKTNRQMKTINRGLLIAFEGLDRAGKTTQANNL